MDPNARTITIASGADGTAGTGIALDGPDSLVCGVQLPAAATGTLRPQLSFDGGTTWVDIWDREDVTPARVTFAAGALGMYYPINPSLTLGGQRRFRVISSGNEGATRTMYAIVRAL